ncbi:MAG: Protein RnfH [Paracidovorax wautersii]|uniref:Protein RnfH n=1 Tax=Paracidovorax wautersii TaxID=1177982 RepID=A0A7V8FQG0_9BURK|nr:MAG: Protein RnfH [Paracidovorax wautersii]
MADSGVARQPAAMEIVVIHAPAPRQVQEWRLRIAPGLQLPAVLPLLAQACGPDIAAQLDSGMLVASVWGERAGPDQVLRDGDRVELCRPLRVDPKVARRERFSTQGARATGLFAKRRAGAKSGY